MLATSSVRCDLGSALFSCSSVDRVSITVAITVALIGERINSAKFVVRIRKHASVM